MALTDLEVMNVAVSVGDLPETAQTGPSRGVAVQYDVFVHGPVVPIVAEVELRVVLSDGVLANFYRDAVLRIVDETQGASDQTFSFSFLIDQSEVEGWASFFVYVFASPADYHVEAAEPNKSDNFGTFGPYTLAPDTETLAQEVLDQFGHMGLLARLAQAAYWLDPVEIVGDDFNFAKAGADLAYGALRSAGLSYVTGRDLTTIAWKEVNNRWGGEGLTSNGLYLNKNAAALVARTDDALFLSFRGTNDNDQGHALGFDTPDEDHWSKMHKHGHLFDKLFDALRAYVTQAGSGIEKIYVTGHSLGAGMVEWFLYDQTDRNGQVYSFAGTGIEIDTQTFASPGLSMFPLTPPYNGARNVNFWIDGDVIEAAAIGGENTGDENEVYHDLPHPLFGWGITAALHGSNLYVAFAQALHSEGIGTAELSQKALHGIDYDRVYVHVGGNPDLAGVTAEIIGIDNDEITGSDFADIMLGMGGRDTLYGGGGRDHLQGGVGQDVLYGGTQDDFLYGGPNADRLDGGMGKDVLEGGAGADTFYFYNAAANRKTPIGLSINDTITDFEKRLDKIDLSLIDTRLKLGDQAFDYLGLGNFTGARGEVRWEWGGGNTLIYGDLNGDKTADFGIVLLGQISLLKGDFIL